MSPPRNIANWKTLHNAGFTRIDAILPIPGHAGEFYVFRGPDYIRIIINPSSLSDELNNNGPYNIAEQWPSICSAGFKVVDAAVPVPGHPNDAYIFSGSQYIRIHINPCSLSDTIMAGPSDIATKWSSLGASGFTVIDAALPVPGHSQQIYFFRGSKYVRVILDEHGSDTIHNYGPHKIEEQWPTIQEAGLTCVDACMPVPGRAREWYMFCGSKYIRIKIQANASLNDTRVY